MRVNSVDIFFPLPALQIKITAVPQVAMWWMLIKRMWTLYRSIFNHFYVMGPKSYRSRRNTAI